MERDGRGLGDFGIEDVNDLGVGAGEAEESVAEAMMVGVPGSVAVMVALPWASMATGTPLAVTLMDEIPSEI